MTTEKEKLVLALNSYNLRPAAIANRIKEDVVAVEAVLAANKKMAALKKIRKKVLKNKKQQPENTSSIQRPPAIYSNRRPYDF